MNLPLPPAPNQPPTPDCTSAYIPPMRTPRRALVALLPALVLAAGACDRGATPAREAGSVFRGVMLNTPLEKPDFTLTDVNGEPYNFRLKTAGKVALLFFGYTHCPDVCPLHAANVAAVLRQMPFDEREKIQFVFVTTDPERDTPARLKEWLGNFDTSFVGLSGAPDELAKLQAAVGIPPARREYLPGADSANYLVGHGAQVLAFGLDNFARIEYPFGIRQEDWANDLPRLARGEVPRPRAIPTDSSFDVNLTPSTVAVPAGPQIQVEVALMPVPATTTEAAVYLVIHNNGGEDTLSAVSSPEAKDAMIHRTVERGALRVMEPVSVLPIRPGETLRFLPGGTHVMLMQLARKPVAGESFPLRLRFAKAGEFVVAPMVVEYADLEAQLGASRPR